MTADLAWQIATIAVMILTVIAVGIYISLNWRNGP